MRNTLCNCPVTIKGHVEHMAKFVGVQKKMDPELVPALVRNLRLAGMAKKHILKHLYGLESNPTSRPTITETRPADRWVACRTGHITPLLEHAKVCPNGITPQHVIAAFWSHGKAVARKKHPNATAPCDTLANRLIAEANRHGLSGIAEGFKTAMRFNRTW
jgi:hypothetical protein